MTDLLRRRGALLAALGGAAAIAGMTRWGRSSRRAGELELWFSYGGRNREVLLDMVAQFHREQRGSTVLPTFQGDYFEALVKLRTALFVGSAPSVTHVVGEVIPYLDRASALSSLDDIGDATESDIAPALGQSGTFVGGGDRPLLALPFNRSTPIAYYNKPLFAELGLQPPRTWRQMREVARACTTRDGDRVTRWGFECPIDWWFWIALVGQAGGQVIERDGRVSLGGEAGVRAVEHWQAMIHDDRSMKPPPGRDYNAWEATNNDFLAGRAAMIWTSTAFLRYLEDNASFEVGAAPLPQGERFSVPTGGTFFVVPRGVKGAEREAAISFLRWMMKPPQAITWATRTGYMPVSRRAQEQLSGDGYYDAHPNDHVAMAQLKHAQPWPWSPELFRVQREAVQPRLERAVLQNQSASEMLVEARRSLEAT